MVCLLMLVLKSSNRDARGHRFFIHKIFDSLVLHSNKLADLHRISSFYSAAVADLVLFFNYFVILSHHIFPVIVIKIQ